MYVLGFAYLCQKWVHPFREGLFLDMQTFFLKRFDALIFKLMDAFTLGHIPIVLLHITWWISARLILWPWKLPKNKCKNRTFQSKNKIFKKSSRVRRKRILFSRWWKKKVRTYFRSISNSVNKPLRIDYVWVQKQRKQRLFRSLRLQLKLIATCLCIRFA